MEQQNWAMEQMVKKVREDPTRIEALRNNPVEEIEKLKDEVEKEYPAYIGDRVLYRIAVIVLGSLTVIAALGSIVLVLSGHETPEVLVALGSAAVGSLVGLFAPSPTGR